MDWCIIIPIHSHIVKWKRSKSAEPCVLYNLCTPKCVCTYAYAIYEGCPGSTQPCNIKNRGLHGWIVFSGQPSYCVYLCVSTYVHVWICVLWLYAHILESMPLWKILEETADNGFPVEGTRRFTGVVYPGEPSEHFPCAWSSFLNVLKASV